jgi:hypothetical protein
MMTLKQLAATHHVATAEQFEADDNRPVDLEFYPDATIHAYAWTFRDGTSMPAYILQMKDGYHFTFMHPCDEIAPTLQAAIRGLHQHFAENAA